ncbi:MAG: putative Oxidoreductase with FAD/NAD(P)-binding domain [Phycisphaerales bacterium]|nr:putative Oxidoreductase with FAD/NAD(P)-binding domain [Phycisphaerales bacterium]
MLPLTDFLSYHRGVSEACDIAIVGAGAAGLAAAIFAGEAAQAAGGPRPRILLLDGAKTIGAKILVAGGGRCNVTHDEVRPEDFQAPRTIVRNVLAAFDAQATVRWMRAMGVELKREDTGKLFPVTDSARTVLDALLRRCDELGVELRREWRVTGIERDAGDRKDGRGDAETRGRGEGDCKVQSAERSVQSGGEAAAVDSESLAPSAPQSEISNLKSAICNPPSFPASPRPRVPASAPLLPASSDAPFTLRHADGELLASRVILATGGRSLPRTGSDGAGWAIARRMGHTVTDTFPALVPLVLADGFFHATISGLSHEAELATFVEGKRVDRRTGSLLWTHFGISGPVAMDASRFWVMAHGRKQAAELRCSFLPGESFEQAEKWLIDAAGARPRASVGKLVAERLPQRLADALLRHAGIDPARPSGQLSREHRRGLAHALTALPLPVVRDRGWNYAEVTAGGVPVEEVDFRTMASRKVPGLFLAGEILDCDGRIGGFNFQWAWATGYLAGRGAVRSLRRDSGSV